MRHVLTNDTDCWDVRHDGHDESTACWCEPEVDFEQSEVRHSSPPIIRHAEEIKSAASCQILTDQDWCITQIADDFFLMTAGQYAIRCNGFGLRWLIGESAPPQKMPKAGHKRI